MKRLVWALPFIAALSYAVWLTYARQVYAAGLPPFDLHPFQYDEALRYLAALSPQAKATYLGPLHRIDTVLLISLAATLLVPVWRRGWIWCLPALGYAAADLLENDMVSNMLQNGLNEVGEIAVLSAVTRAKFACVGLAALVAGVSLLLDWRRNHGAAAQSGGRK